VSPFNNDRLADYVDVKERIRLFYLAHPDGRLTTTGIKVTSKPDGVPRVWASAAAFRTPDDPIPGVGTSWMVLPGSTSFTKGSEIENTETSAWGRAIGALGIGIDKSIASRDEVHAKSGEADRPTTTHDDGLVGMAEVGKGDADFELRQDEVHDWRLMFRLVQGRKGYKVATFGPMAEAIATLRPVIEGQRITVWGTLHDETFRPAGATKDVTYQVVHAERIQTPDGILPAPGGPVEAPTEALPWDPAESARLDAEA
jgi:hypothetical protein